MNFQTNLSQHLFISHNDSKLSQEVPKRPINSKIAISGHSLSGTKITGNKYSFLRIPHTQQASHLTKFHRCSVQIIEHFPAMICNAQIDTNTSRNGPTYQRVIYLFLKNFFQLFHSEQSNKTSRTQKINGCQTIREKLLLR